MSRTALGVALRGARLAAGLTQAEVARAAGVDHTYLSHLESGRRLPSRAVLVRMLEAFGVGVDVLDYVRGAAGDGVSDALAKDVVTALRLGSYARRAPGSE